MPERPLERPVIEALLQAAVQAPTAIRKEPWAFVVIQDRALLKRLSDSAKAGLLYDIDEMQPFLRATASEHVASPDFNIFYDAGTLIVIYGKPKGVFVAADCWLAAENLMLAARAHGLGSCVIGFAAAALDSPEWKAELGVPPDWTAHAPIIVGVPRGETPAVPRKPPEIVAWR